MRLGTGTRSRNQLGLVIIQFSVVARTGLTYGEAFGSRVSPVLNTSMSDMLQKYLNSRERSYIKSGSGYRACSTHSEPLIHTISSKLVPMEQSYCIERFM